MPDDTLANFKMRGGGKNLGSCQKIPDEVKDVCQDFVFLKPYQTGCGRRYFRWLNTSMNQRSGMK
jgi:hypothetical protein